MSDVADKLRLIVSHAVGVPVDAIIDATVLASDLAADSMDIYDILFEAEREWVLDAANMDVLPTDGNAFEVFMSDAPNVHITTFGDLAAFIEKCITEQK